MISYSGKISLVLFCLLGLLACESTPELSEKDRKVLKHEPAEFQTDYSIAIDALWELINEGHNFPSRIIQPLKVSRAVTKEELPYDITQMVTSAIARLSGPNLKVAPFNAVDLGNDKKLFGYAAETRKLPDYQIVGTVTEYDEGIKVAKKGKELDLLLGGGTGQSDIGYSNAESYKHSRITIDFQLITYVGQVIENNARSVVNTMEVVEIKKGREYGFAIKGTNVGISGRMEHSQGIHRAVRYLVDFSVLQLIGRLYQFPYWIPLELNEDRFVMNALESSYNVADKRNRVRSVQDLLNIMGITSGFNTETGASYQGKLVTDGEMGNKTKAYIREFLVQIGLDPVKTKPSTVYAKLVENTTFSPESLVKFNKSIAEMHRRSSSSNVDNMLLVAGDYIKNGQYDKAIATLDVAISQDPQNTKATSMKKSALNLQLQALSKIKIQ